MLSDILSRARKEARRTRAYEVWRQLRRAQQLRAFNAVLDGHLSEPTGEAARYDPAHTILSLNQRAPQRRPLLTEQGRPRVVAFGAEGWERHGLWPSFARISDFHFSEYGLEFVDERSLPDDFGPARRRALGQGFLRFIDAVEEREGPVSFAFFYAAGKHICDDILDELARRGIWSVVMSLDDKQLFFSTDSHTPDQLRVASRCDLYWTTWRTGTQIVLNQGGNPWYSPEGADPEFHRHIDRKRDIDIVFVGQCYGMRMKLVRYLRERGLRVETWGSGWPNGFASFEKTVELFNRAKIVLGVGGVGMMDEISHLKGRDFEVPMCGAVYLTSFNPELADHYHVGRHIFCYSSFEECADTAHWLLRQPEICEGARQNVRAHCTKHHTWERRLSDLLDLFPGHST